MKRKIYNTDKSTVSGPYSHAVDGGDYIFLAGQTARNSTKNIKDNLTIREETEEIFNILFDIIEKTGLTPDNVVKVNVYLTSMKDFHEMNEVYKTKFSEPFPARTAIAVLELPLGANVEIEMIVKR